MTAPAPTGISTKTPPWLAEVQAHQRAMPLQRLIGNGMDYADVVELYALAESGVPWAQAGEQLGDRNWERGRAAERTGHLLSAQQWYLHASRRPVRRSCRRGFLTSDEGRAVAAGQLLTGRLRPVRRRHRDRWYTRLGRLRSTFR